MIEIHLLIFTAVSGGVVSYFPSLPVAIPLYRGFRTKRMCTTTNTIVSQKTNPAGKIHNMSLQNLPTSLLPGPRCSKVFLAVSEKEERRLETLLHSSYP